MKKTLFPATLIALAVSTVLVGCAKDTPPPPPAPTPAPVEQSTEVDRPGKALVEKVSINATVKAVDKKKRTVTLKFENGKTAKVETGPEVRNFSQIKVGDNVTVDLLESVELFVEETPEAPTADKTIEVARAPKGSKPGIAAVETIELKATVESIDYKTREVVLKGPEGKLQKVTVGPEAKRFNEVKKGDTVVARLTKAASIIVSSPKK